jgi:hypothetical protein
MIEQINTPNRSVVHLFRGELYPEQINKLKYDGYDIGGAETEAVFWLNTPGPVYTTCTDNCGTGQIEAMYNVGGDCDYYEFLFKQPFDEFEMEQVKSAAYFNPLAGYYFDGNKYWTNKRIVKWWNGIETVINYMVERYDEELRLPTNPHRRLVDLGDGPKEIQLHGPGKPLPENYKSALDFYQYGIKEYLEWYMKINNGVTVNLQGVKYDWSRKLELDGNLLERAK